MVGQWPATAFFLFDLANSPDQPHSHVMNRRLIALFFSAFTVAPSHLASAQDMIGAVSECGTDGPMVWARVVMGRLCRLAENAEVKKATQASNAVALLGAVPNDILWRLSDDELIAFVGVFARSLEPLAPSVCATLYPGASEMNWGEKVMEIATAADSLLSEEWAGMLEAWVWAAVRKVPRQAEASSSDVYRVLQAQLGSLTIEERADLGALSRSDVLPEDRACRAVKAIYAAMARGTAEVVSPVLRTLMHGKIPWTVQT